MQRYELFFLLFFMLQADVLMFASPNTTPVGSFEGNSFTSVKPEQKNEPTMQYECPPCNHLPIIDQLKNENVVLQNALQKLNEESAAIKQENEKLIAHNAQIVGELKTAKAEPEFIKTIKNPWFIGFFAIGTIYAVSLVNIIIMKAEL